MGNLKHQKIFPGGDPNRTLRRNIQQYTPPRVLTRKVTLMMQYCLTAREAAEQSDLSLDALMVLVEQHADVAVNVKGAWRVDPVRLAEITGDTAWQAAA